MTFGFLPRESTNKLKASCENRDGPVDVKRSEDSPNVCKHLSVLGFAGLEKCLSLRAFSCKELEKIGSCLSELVSSHSQKRVCFLVSKRHIFAGLIAHENATTR